MISGTILHLLKGLDKFLDKLENDWKVGSKKVHYSGKIQHFLYCVPVQPSLCTGTQWQKRGSKADLVISHLISIYLTPARLQLSWRRLPAAREGLSSCDFFILVQEKVALKLEEEPPTGEARDRGKGVASS
uniref:Uncharacterized protein n=1 Tax=Ananas comosus var. bracteatus TaxID=296719 RepID=A0A6V7PPD8_ANACO|nr:unnamed protein product [Ananas comosus var. bracteatus]